MADEVVKRLIACFRRNTGSLDELDRWVTWLERQEGLMPEPGVISDTIRSEMVARTAKELLEKTGDTAFIFGNPEDGFLVATRDEALLRGVAGTVPTHAQRALLSFLQIFREGGESVSIQDLDKALHAAEKVLGVTPQEGVFSARTLIRMGMQMMYAFLDHYAEKGIKTIAGLGDAEQPFTIVVTKSASMTEAVANAARAEDQTSVLASDVDIGVPGQPPPVQKPDAGPDVSLFGVTQKPGDA